MQESLIVRGAREHNLKDITVNIPRNKFVVFTGLSGSGKSTLAFDTIYAEGQRRYVESLSSYARQFLGVMNKPDVDSIEGLSPAISIEQKTTSKNPRSTVGTITEIYDYLRLLFSRIGLPHCPKHHVPIEKKTAVSISEGILKEFQGKEFLVLAPIVSQKKGTYEKLLLDLAQEGFLRVRVNGTIYRTDEKVPLERYKKHTIEIVIDRLTGQDSSRLFEAVESTLKKSGGLVLVVCGKEEKLYSSLRSCPFCDITFEELQPRMFSFNSPFGACEECHGLGFKQEIDPDLVIPDQRLALADGAVKAYNNKIDSWRLRELGYVAKRNHFTLFTPIKDLSEQQLFTLFYGDDEFEGIIRQLERLHQHTDSEYRRQEIEKFMRILNCPKCKGKRLKEKVLAVTIFDKHIMDVCDFSIKECLQFFSTLSLSTQQQNIASLILKEIIQRLTFLDNVGLSYLTLSRSAGTLSGGEAQRIRLATQIGANLMGVLYVLDEPSIGLHQKDNAKLIETLHKLRDLGNTLIVVEHDEETITHADYVVDLGPGAGVHGGYVVAQGTPEEIIKHSTSLTGQYLSGKLSIPLPLKRRSPRSFLEITGAKEHNLKNISVSLPLRVLSVISGVSGSGKSTLVYDILYKALMQKFYGSKEKPGAHDGVIVPIEHVDKIIMVDQSPIGKTPRSNPATYIKVFDDIRFLFSQTKEAKLKGYGPGRFSFNVSGGRCEACKGDGVIKIEMHFLPDVYVECEECKGRRYNPETLLVLYKGKNISQVLNMSVEEALPFFEAIPVIERKLRVLCEVGLTYITLGQSATTLSGGEAQRIKLTKELAKRGTGNTLYLLDEPTTGLHFHDVKKLLELLNRLVDKGNSVVVIEHNLDVIKCADFVLDLGPEGGNEGGSIVVAGTPEDVAKHKGSYTGHYLKKVLK